MSLKNLRESIMGESTSKLNESFYNKDDRLYLLKYKAKFIDSNEPIFSKLKSKLKKLVKANINVTLMARDGKYYASISTADARTSALGTLWMNAINHLIYFKPDGTYWIDYYSANISHKSTDIIQLTDVDNYINRTVEKGEEISKLFINNPEFIKREAAASTISYTLANTKTFGKLWNGYGGYIEKLILEKTVEEMDAIIVALKKVPVEHLEAILNVSSFTKAHLSSYSRSDNKYIISQLREKFKVKSV